MAATALTCPTFSAINTRTTGKNKSIALLSKVGDVNDGIATHLAASTPAKSTSPIKAAIT